MQGYSNSREHVMDELRRLDVLLNIQLAQQRHDPAFASFDGFRGLFISEAEIEHIMPRARPEQDVAANRDEAQTRELKLRLEQIEKQIADRVRATLNHKIPLVLLRLARQFGLSGFDIDVLLICLAPELELKYEKLYAYLQNDVTRRRPSVDLLLNLLCHTFEEKLRARVRLGSEAPLLCHELISFGGTSAESTTLLSRSVKIDERILNYLLDIDALDEQLSPFTRLITPATRMTDLLLAANLKTKLLRLLQLHASGMVADEARDRRVLVFQGPAGVGKQSTAEAICHALGLRLLHTDCEQLMAGTTPPKSLILRLLREARLSDAALYLDRADVLLESHEPAIAALRALTQGLETFPGIVFIGSTQSWPVSGEAKFSVIQFGFPIPDSVERKQLWQGFLVRSRCTTTPEVDLDALAEKFRFTPQQICGAVVAASQQALIENRAIVYENDLYAACRAQSTTNLSALAHKITPLYSWNDIVLPGDCRNQLREICAHVTHRQRVFSDWNFQSKLSLGKGLSALFVGASGTGKTMAAEIMAHELNLDLYKIDLSSVVSKYIGETEKNLKYIFHEAEQSNAILFFDEADAIFGKRSDVKDSHDRYANIEINYLLQKLEEHEGIVILASNFHKNIDEAFTRRMRFVIDFPFPNEEHRRRIWESVFPSALPRSNTIDFAFLAKKFEIAGGNIKNIVLGAAFLAAEDGADMTMEHIVRAIKREFQKMGRVCMEADFEQYFEFVTGEAIPV